MTIKHSKGSAFALAFLVTLFVGSWRPALSHAAPLSLVPSMLQGQGQPGQQGPGDVSEKHDDGLSADNHVDDKQAEQEDTKANNDVDTLEVAADANEGIQTDVQENDRQDDMQNDQKDDAQQDLQEDATTAPTPATH